MTELKLSEIKGLLIKELQCSIHLDNPSDNCRPCIECEEVKRINKKLSTKNLLDYVEAAECPVCDKNLPISRRDCFNCGGTGAVIRVKESK